MFGTSRVFFLGRQAVGRNIQPAKAVSIVRKPRVAIAMRIDRSRSPIRHWYENKVTRLRQCLEFPRISRIVIPAPFRHSGEGRNPEGRGECSAVEDFARRGACPPLGRRRGLAESRVANFPYQTTTPAFHTLVCRHLPASAIGTKRIPGPDPGCPGPLRLAPGIVIPVPFRHSGEGRNPEGWGNVVRSKTTRGEGLVPRWGRAGGLAKSAATFIRPHPPGSQP